MAEHIVEKRAQDHSNLRNELTSCPMRAQLSGNTGLKSDDTLFFPRHKRVITQYLTNQSGDTELFLFYEDKEISFDEPELFAFGEQLVKQSHFVAETATNWGNGYNWDRIKVLLESLLEEGVLHLKDTDNSISHAGEVCQTNLPPSTCQEPRSWLDCENLTAELTGRPLELAYLELVVPVYRIAHINLDMEGRQVGEANVFPKPLRLNIATEWRSCQYSGSRYLSEFPMNVTALKSMRQHWVQIMTLLSKIREAYLRRFPEVRQGWTVGHVECLSIVALALPAYLLMRPKNRVNNGSLHPALSNMFRVTDGVRGMTHQMLTSPILEATLAPDSAITSSQIYEYTERNYGFQSAYGVCAGPKVMIEEFLDVLLEGKIIDGMSTVKLDDEVQDGLDAIESALDYGLYGLHIYSIIFTSWSLMGRTYEHLGEILEYWPDSNSRGLNKFKQIILTDIKNIQAETVLAAEEWRLSRDHVQAYLHNKTSHGLKLRCSEQTLEQRLTPIPLAHHLVAENSLRTALRHNFGEEVSENNPKFDNLISCIMSHLCREQAMIKAALEAQKCINKMLSRTLPKRAFTAADINIYNMLLGFSRRLPHLSEVLEEVFGIEVVVTQDNIDINVHISD